VQKVRVAEKDNDSERERKTAAETLFGPYPEALGGKPSGGGGKKEGSVWVCTRVRTQGKVARFNTSKASTIKKQREGKRE